VQGAVKDSDRIGNRSLKNKGRKMKNHCLKGKSAVVTGGRRGIGKAIARAFAESGADVAICDIAIDDGLLEKAKQELQMLGAKSLALQIDVSRSSDVGKLTQLAMDAFGKIDILVNCAGVWLPGQTLVECSDENWNLVIDTNLKGTFLCCRAVGRVMAGQKRGSIINLSSQVGLTPGTGVGAYSISKAGIIMLTRQIALELAGYNVRANALAPGIVKTDFNSAFWRDPAVENQTASMVPLKRLAEPEDIAQAALFLASDAASYITGEVLPVSGGWAPTNRL
jgi:NAD(P)-dependent dehydrogenase (short-subunit alcohol dehydrogenase family)